MPTLVKLVVLDAWRSEFLDVAEWFNLLLKKLLCATDYLDVLLTNGCSSRIETWCLRSDTAEVLEVLVWVKPLSYVWLGCLYRNSEENYGSNSPPPPVFPPNPFFHNFSLCWPKDCLASGKLRLISPFFYFSTFSSSLCMMNGFASKRAGLAYVVMWLISILVFSRLVKSRSISSTTNCYLNDCAFDALIIWLLNLTVSGDSLYSSTTGVSETCRMIRMDTKLKF